MGHHLVLLTGKLLRNLEEGSLRFWRHLISGQELGRVALSWTELVLVLRRTCGVDVDHCFSATLKTI
jgi:hypothetical protein